MTKRSKARLTGRKMDKMKKKVLKEASSQTNTKGQVVGNFLLLELVLGVLLKEVINDNFEGNKSLDLIKEQDFIRSIIRQHVEMHNKLIIELGIKFGTKRYKEISNYCINLLERGYVPGSVNDLRLSCGRSDGWPKMFGYLRPLYHHTTQNNCHSHLCDQILRTIFAIPRMVEDFSEIDLKSIQEPGKDISQFRIGFKKFLKSRIQSNLWKGIATQIWECYPSTGNTTASPCAGPRWNCLELEAKLLVKNESLFKPFKKLCELSGNTDLYLMVVDLAATENPISQLHMEHGLNRPLSLRRIMAVADTGNKSRTIALGDRFTQTLLKPLEDLLLKIISENFGSVCDIFDHNNGFDKLKRYIKPGVQSLDASSWTDRLPAILQKDVLEFVTSKGKADAWYELVVKCVWNVPSEGTTIKYAVGQAMGIHASFALATLTDLLLIEYGMSIHYPEQYKFYLENPLRREELFNKIGDDLWIMDPDNKFVKFYEDIGVDINMSKSKRATDDNIVGEYVSCNINKGNNVSRISSRLARQTEQNVFILPVWVYHLLQRIDQRLVQDIVREIVNSKTIYKKEFLLINLAKMCILEQSTFGVESFISKTGKFVFDSYPIDSEAYKDICEFEKIIKGPKAVEISIGLLLLLIEKEWAPIEAHLEQFKNDLKDDRITYYSKAIPIVDKKWFSPDLYKKGHYITNVLYGKAVQCKNERIAPFIFKGERLESHNMAEILVSLREILEEVKYFSLAFTPLSEPLKEVFDSRYKMHKLHRALQLMSYKENGKVKYNPDILLDKFKSEFATLDEALVTSTLKGETPSIPA